MIRKGIFIIISHFLAVHSFSQDVNSDSVRVMNDYLYASKKIKIELAKRIGKEKIKFDYVYNRLKIGKQFSQDVPKGFFEHNFKNQKGIEHPNLVFIPYKYNPEKKYQVRVFLHGGISSLDLRQIYGMVNRIDTAWQSVNTICLYPSSWLLSPWWSYNQYENISELLEFIKDNYNVDENNIYLNGVSDGATGIFYLSNFYQTPFSCYLPFIGSMEMLPSLKDKQFYLKNYQGLSFFIVNGRKDPIFDINFVVPSISELKKTALEVKFFVVDSSKHNTRWYPVLKDSIRNFINSHKRNPFPNEVYYATEKPDTFNRKFWVRIDRIGRTKADGKIEDTNQIKWYDKIYDLFPRAKQYGQIKVTKDGNTVNVETMGTKKYTLLISPSHFDITKPIVVFTNNKLSFEGTMPKDLNVLLKNYNTDNDRTMLYSGEIKITVVR